MVKRYVLIWGLDRCRNTIRYYDDREIAQQMFWNKIGEGWDYVVLAPIKPGQQFIYKC